MEPSDAEEIAKTGGRMLALTQRSLAAAGKIQSHAIRTATGSEFSLMDAATLGRAYSSFWAEMMADPAALFRMQMKAAEGVIGAWGALLQGGSPEPEGKVRDRRFADRDWEEDPLARTYRDVYLAFEEAAEGLLDGLSPGSKDHLRVSFYTRQMLSALSPANYLATNAAARRKAMETHGKSLLDGFENLLDDLERGEGRLDMATNDKTAYTVGKDLATTEGAVVYQNDLIQLIQYAPRTKEQYAVPMLLVPAWINKFYILDLQPKNSLVRYLLDQGHSVFVISWVNPTREHAEMDFGDYMRLGPLAALDAIREITGEEQANILGFCIGGILVTATLAYLAAKGEGDRILSATTLATMVDFKDVGEIGVFVDDHRLEVLREHMKDKGYLEAHHLQDMFSMLRENDLIWSFYEQNYLKGAKPRAFDLLFWNSDSTRLPAAMLLWYLEEVYLENRLRAPGGVTLNGVALDVSKIRTPCFVLATRDDHIAPWRSVYPATQLFGGEVEFVLGGSGHIAGVINPPAERPKYGFRTAKNYPSGPDDFLAVAEETPGSWWPYWAEWLDRRLDRKVPARAPAKRGKYKAIEPAPGRYVLRS